MRGNRAYRFVLSIMFLSTSSRNLSRALNRNIVLGFVIPTVTLAHQRRAPFVRPLGSSVTNHRRDEHNRTQNKTDELISDNEGLNLSTATHEKLKAVISSWGFPKYRADQVYHWINERGITNTDEMDNIPKNLRQKLSTFTRSHALDLVYEQVSKDGTIKRAYRCQDGQVIESVLMPYEDGRYTACVSSQAGCAQGCVFCATGQMGYSRQLHADEIYEQVARFAYELKQQDKGSVSKPTHPQGKRNRLSNVVFMGMGEPLANYRNVVAAVRRITTDLGIGARKITISTVGLVPNIRKMFVEDTDMPPVRLAVSLHCATDNERTALLPANRRNGGLKELMTTLREYIESTGRRITLEWALINGENDTPETARTLGNLVKQYGLRRDMVHVNVIPLNPTGGFEGGPSSGHRVNRFINTLEKEFGIACSPRVRRGIDIDAGCGQLRSKVNKEQTE